MLSNIASYLMGGSITTLTSITSTLPSVGVGAGLGGGQPSSQQVTQGTVHASQELRCTEDEDWLLVDPTGNSRDDTTPSGSTTGSAPITIERVEDSENAPPGRSIEESWYVAPPACYAPRRPVKLATSPLENLLIEHPSMSVYHHSITEESHSQSSSPTETIEEEGEEEGEEEMELEGKKKRRRQQVLPSPPAPHFRPNKLSVDVAMQSERGSGKKDRSGRTQLERLNKCKMAPGHQKLRRSDRQHSAKNSFANNNRKCSQRC